MLFCRTVDGIQDIDHRIDTADDGVILIDKTGQLGFQHAFHLFDRIRTGPVHESDTSGDIGLTVRRQRGKHQSALIR